MRTSASTVRSAGERRVTTPWEASDVSAPPASTMSRLEQDAQTSTSAPPPTTLANLVVQTQMEDISADVLPGTSAQGKGMCKDGCVKAVCRCFHLADGFVFVPQTLCHRSWLY